MKVHLYVVYQTDNKTLNLDVQVDEVVRELEEVDKIHHELRLDTGTQKKADKYLPDKSINERKKNPTDLADSLSASVARKRRSELFEGACQINGGSNEKNYRVPGEVSLCSTTVKKCSDSTLVKVFSKSKKTTRRVIPKIYKKSCSLGKFR